MSETESNEAIIYDLVDGSDDPLHREAKIAWIAEWLKHGDYDRNTCDNVYDLAQAWTEYEESVK